MKLWVNGESFEIEEGATVLTLLSLLKMEHKPVVIEWNGEALVSSEWGETVLSSGDRVEIVVLVAGG